MRVAVRKRLRYAVIAAMPRPAADTAEQTVSAIIRSSRLGSVGHEYFCPFHPAPSGRLGAMLRPEIREI